MRFPFQILRPCPLVALALATATLLTACEEPDQVRVYSVPKAEERPAGVHAHDDLTDHEEDEVDAAQVPRAGDVDRVTWEVPERWRELEGERPMRVATFESGEGEAALEVAVSVFPGDTGGLLANVNRWRGQVGLEPISESELDAAVETFGHEGFQGHTMRLEGPEMHLVGAAIYEEAVDRTWFVKAVGTPAVVDDHEADVVAFSRSFRAEAAEQ